MKLILLQKLSRKLSTRRRKRLVNVTEGSPCTSYLTTPLSMKKSARRAQRMEETRMSSPFCIDSPSRTPRMGTRRPRRWVNYTFVEFISHSSLFRRLSWPERASTPQPFRLYSRQNLTQMLKMSATFCLIFSLFDRIMYDKLCSITCSSLYIYSLFIIVHAILNLSHG